MWWRSSSGRPSRPAAFGVVDMAEAVLAGREAQGTREQGVRSAQASDEARS